MNAREKLALIRAAQEQGGNLDARAKLSLIRKAATPTLDRLGLTGADVKAGKGPQSAGVGEKALGLGVDVVTGVGDALGGLVGLSADVSTLPFRKTAASAKELLRTKSLRNAAAAGAAEPLLPVTSLAGEASEDFRKTARGTLGLDDSSETAAGPIARFVADVAVPIPGMKARPRGASKAERVIAFYEKKIAATTDPVAKKALTDEMRRTVTALAPPAPTMPAPPAGGRGIAAAAESLANQTPGSKRGPEMTAEEIALADRAGEAQAVAIPAPQTPGQAMMKARAQEGAPFDATKTPDGMVRFYHGGHRYDSGSRWLTPSLEDAKGWARKTGGDATVQYVDIPEDSALLAKSFDDTGTSMKAPYIRFEAPEGVASGLRPWAEVNTTGATSDAAGAARSAEVTSAQAVPGVESATPLTDAAEQAVRRAAARDQGIGKPGRAGETYTKIREFVDDEWIRVKKLVEDPKNKVTEASDPYTAEILSHGRLGSRIEEGRDLVKAIDSDQLAAAKTLGVDDVAMREDINSFLVARHAPDFNAHLGDRAAGISTNDAMATLAKIEASPHGAEVKRIADRLQEINNRTLDVLLEGEVIDRALYDTLRSRYKNHVPLNRVMDDVDDMGAAISARPLDVRSSGLMRGVGSERKVADITANIETNYEQALVRAEKNRVDLATLRFSRDNPDLGIFEEFRPKAIGKTFDDEGILLKRVDDPQVLALREDGKQVYLRIKDPNLATALKSVGRYKVDGVLRVVGAYTRFMSGLATRFNPEFFLPNKVRDLQEAMVYAFSKGELGAKGALKIGVRDPLSARKWVDVIDGLRGVDSEGGRLYRQMKLDGGTTGGMGLSTRKQVELNIEAIRAANRSTPRAAAVKLMGYIDFMNAVFEDSTRLSVYRTAIEQGSSRPRAARMAKEASINFNKFGRGGPQINALYMFANASIQGSMKMARAMDPRTAAGRKTALAVSTAVGVAVAATAEWNDSVDPRWREHVSKYDRLSSLPVMLPPSEDGSVNYFTIPVSWGIKPIKVAMDYAYEGMSGDTDLTPGEAVSGTLAATVEGYNPVGGTDVGSALMPTVGDLPLDLARNRKWSGAMVKPDWDKTKPESAKYFDDLPESMTGQAAIEVTERLSDRGIEVSPADVKYAFETLVGGVGRTTAKVANTAVAVAKGTAPKTEDIPVASRFLKHVPAEQIGQRESAIANKRADRQSMAAQAEALRVARALRRKMDK